MILHKRGMDRLLLIVTIAMSVFGIVMIGDVSVGMAAKYGTVYATKNMLKQAAYVLLGLFGMSLLAHNFQPRHMSRRFLYVLYFIVLVLMLVCRLWVLNGSHAWIKIGKITIQPVEFMKLVLILIMAVSCGNLPEMIDPSKFRQARVRAAVSDQKLRICVIYPLFMVGTAFLVCAFWQNDLGSSLILAAIAYVILLCAPYNYYARIKRLSFMAVGALVVLVVILGATNILASHQLARIDSWLHPLQNIYNSSWQTVNGLVGYVNGGLIGRGFGNSLMKYGYIPEAQNDFISAIIVEELGLLGFGIILFLYCIIIFKMFNYAIKINDTTDKLTLIGIATYFTAHLFVNIGGVSGLIPMTGVPLLLISAGGTSTVTALCSIGIAQSIIIRYHRAVRQEAVEAELEKRQAERLAKGVFHEV